MLATMGPGAAEQVIAVLATGGGKTLIFMVAARLAGAGTTIVVVPTVALRDNLLDRLSIADITTVVWVPGEWRSAPLVLISAEAACTTGFLDYAHGLVLRQKLDRIVMDECHLTIIAASYRQSMRDLGSYMRQIQTQTVWLTATLPPDREALLIRRNMLVWPRMVRESMNRATLQYMVRRYKGAAGLCEQTVRVVRELAAIIRRAGAGAGAGEGDGGDRDGDEGKRSTIPGGQNAKIIIYCQTIKLMDKIAAALGCPTYTGDQDSISAADKAAALHDWLGPGGSPAIVATSALGVGFDCAFMRWVIHTGPPRCMTDFSQESGGPAETADLPSLSCS